MGLDVSPMSGEDVTKLVRETANLPAELLKRYGALLAQLD